MLTLALLALVVQAGVMSGAPNAGHPPVSILARSETPAISGPRFRLLVRIDSPPEISGLGIGDLIENVRSIWRPYADVDFGRIGAEALVRYDDELCLLITERPQPGRAAAGAVLGWIEFLDGRPRNTITVS